MVVQRRSWEEAEREADQRTSMKWLRKEQRSVLNKEGSELERNNNQKVERKRQPTSENIRRNPELYPTARNTWMFEDLC